MKKVFKKRDIVFGFCTVLPLFLISCASMGVSSKGKDYFIGKSEKTISDYFGGATVTIPDETGEYDKISWFTNREYVVTLTKDIIKQYKSTNTKTVFKFLYYEYPDGCRFSSDQKHYSLYGADIKTGEDVVTHNAGDNAYVNNQIAVFNNNLKTLGCINSSQENAYLSNSKIGDTFYVSDVETKIAYSEKGYLGNPSGNVTRNTR